MLRHAAAAPASLQCTLATMDTRCRPAPCFNGECGVGPCERCDKGYNGWAGTTAWGQANRHEMQRSRGESYPQRTPTSKSAFRDRSPAMHLPTPETMHPQHSTPNPYSPHPPWHSRALNAHPETPQRPASPPTSATTHACTHTTLREALRQQPNPRGRRRGRR